MTMTQRARMFFTAQRSRVDIQQKDKCTNLWKQAIKQYINGSTNTTIKALSRA